MLFAILLGAWFASQAAARSYTTYSSNIKIILDTPESNLVKVGINPGEHGTFARTIQLAGTYSYLVKSDPVLERLQSRFGRIKEAIEVQPVQNAPIIDVSVTGMFPRRVEGLTKALAESFQEYITASQDAKDIDRNNRIIVNTLGANSPASPLKSRKTETVVLLFFGPVMLGALLAFTLENLQEGSNGNDDRNRFWRRGKGAAVDGAEA